jgi:alpha-beta hydrolase superfamily lysophospholipase
MDAFLSLRPTAEETLGTASGMALHCELFATVGAPRGAAVIVHGFSAHCGNYRHVAKALAEAGIDTTMFDCQGHGQSTGRRGFVRRFSDFHEDLALVMEHTRRRNAGLPLAIVAHSHGATIAIDMLLAGRASADALVAAAPYLGLKMKVPAYKRLLSPVLGGLWPTLALGNELRSGEVTRNSAVWEEMDTDPLIHRVATPRWFNEVRAAQARILAGAAAWRTPTLMLLATGDRIVDNDAALAFAQQAGPMVATKQYEGLFHELFLEPERDTVIADIARWLLAPNARGAANHDPYT